MLLLPGDEDEIGVHLGTAMMLSNIFSSWIMFLNFIILNIIIQFLNQSRLEAYPVIVIHLVSQGAKLVHIGQELKLN